MRVPRLGQEAVAEPRSFPMSPRNSPRKSATRTLVDVVLRKEAVFTGSMIVVRFMRRTHGLTWHQARPRSRATRGSSPPR